jgi:ribosomal protein L11 methylase PrmA
MGWIEIVIEVAREHAEALSDALMDTGALSVSVEDADEGTEAKNHCLANRAWNRKKPHGIAAAWSHSPTPTSTMLNWYVSLLKLSVWTQSQHGRPAMWKNRTGCA